MNAVRKCLQTSLVPLLRPFQRPSCHDIWTRASGSHTRCYQNPYQYEPSMCDIGFQTWFSVFTTVRLSLDWGYWTRFAATPRFLMAKEGLEMGLKCPWKKETPVLEIEFNVAESATLTTATTTAATTTTTAKVITTTEAAPMSASVVIEREMYTVVNEIQIEIGKQYEPAEIIVYPFLAETSNTRRRKRSVNNNNFTTVIVNVLVASRAQYDLDLLYNTTSRIDATQVLEYFLNLVEGGQFQPSVSEGVTLTKYRVCTEWECQNVTRVVTQPPPKPSEDSGFRSQIHCRYSN